MAYLILTVYELITTLLPFIFVFAAFSKRDKREGRENSSLHFPALCAFMIYIFAALHFTGAGTIFDLLQYKTYIFQDELNLQPFTNYINKIEYIQNVLLFVPLGFILPFIWPHANKFKYALMSGLLLSFFIETSQLLNHRATDIDDLIVNTAGALLGYLLFKLFERTTKRDNPRSSYPKYEPFIYTAAMFAGHFLLYYAGLTRIFYSL